MQGGADSKVWELRSAACMNYMKEGKGIQSSREVGRDTREERTEGD